MPNSAMFNLSTYGLFLLALIQSAVLAFGQVFLKIPALADAMELFRP